MSALYLHVNFKVICSLYIAHVGISKLYLISKQGSSKISIALMRMNMTLLMSCSATLAGHEEYFKKKMWPFWSNLKPNKIYLANITERS